MDARQELLVATVAAAAEEEFRDDPGEVRCGQWAKLLYWALEDAESEARVMDLHEGLLMHHVPVVEGIGRT